MPALHETVGRVPQQQLLPDNPLLPGGVDLGRNFIGGEAPQHWAEYLNRRNLYHPMGKDTVYRPVPNSSVIMAQVQEPANLVSGGSGDPWRSTFQLTTGAMRNGYNPAASNYSRT